MEMGQMAPPSAAATTSAASTTAAPSSTAAAATPDSTAAAAATASTAISKKPPKARKAIKPRSEVWVQFDKFETEDGDRKVLDPRHKIKFVELVLVDLHDEIVGESLGQKVREDMKRLYVAYCEIYDPKLKANESIETSSISCSSDVSMHNEEGEELKNERKLRFKRLRSEAGAYRNRSELELYLQEDVVQDDEGFCILDWWRKHSPRYPILSRMAKDVLAVPVSTVASESAFSTGGRVLDCFRSSLTFRVVQSLICSQDWFRKSRQDIKIEENIADLDKWEIEYEGVEIEKAITEL